MSTKRIVVSYAPLYSSSRHGSELETQCLLGELFEIDSTEDEFALGTLLTDNYRGWVPLSAFGSVPTPTHRVLAPCTWLREKSDIKSASLMPVFAGSLLCVTSCDKDNCAVDLEGKTGFMPSSHVISLDATTTSSDWVAVAEQFIGVPYVWGGRTFAGLDCSALVQLAAQTANIILPRNSSQQQICFEALKDVSQLQRGDLVFWKGHVGVMQSSDQLLHANAHHMQVASEPLQSAIKRIAVNDGPVTAMQRLPRL